MASSALSSRAHLVGGPCLRSYSRSYAAARRSPSVVVQGASSADRAAKPAGQGGGRGRTPAPGGRTAPRSKKPNKTTNVKNREEAYFWQGLLHYTTSVPLPYCFQLNSSRDFIPEVPELTQVSRVPPTKGA